MTTIIEQPATHTTPVQAGAGIRVIPAREGWATYPAVAADGEGNVWAAWIERLEGADALWLAAGDGPPREVARAAAIKDGPALAWSAADGLSCAWQFCEDRAANAWHLAVAHQAQDPGALRREAIQTDPVRRPSHPALVSGGTHLLLAYELHGPGGAEIVLHARRGGGWSAPVTLSRRAAAGTGTGATGAGPLGATESAYDPALALTAGGTLWAAWVEARGARLDVWAAHVPVERAGETAAWSAPQRLSGGAHFCAGPQLLAAGEDVWLSWSNYSGDDSGLVDRPWANGPERRWERILFKTRRRAHVRRWSAANQAWGAEWREPHPAPEPSPNPALPPSTPNTHWPVLFPLGADRRAVGLLCRRSLRVFRWSIEAHRLHAEADGRLTWSAPATVAGVLGGGGSEAGSSAGVNLPVAVTSTPDGQVFAAWQRHDRARAAPGFHFTMGSSQIVLAPLDLHALAAQPGSHAGEVGPPAAAPDLLREWPAARGVEIDGQRYRLVFGNLHRHAECSSCGRDANGPAEQHMRHAPDVNRNEYLSVTDHGEHLNDGEWREQCILADFYTWPGHRVALPGIEWTSEAPWHPPAHGHKNIIFSRSDLPWVDCWMPHSDHPHRLWAWLAEQDPQAVTIPHHMMRGKAPTLWEHADERFQPVVEIFQDTRGSCEWLGAPAASSTERVQGLGLDPRGSVRRALDRGLKVGFIASSDHGGVALGGVYVKELSREGILEALRARRCFATTGDRLLLDFRVNGTFQGGEVTLTEIPSGPANQAPPLTITLRAEVLRPVQRLVLVRDGAEALVETPDPAARTIERTWRLEGPFIGTSYFYVRLESADGELAWSSPIWVTRDWGVRD